MTTYFNNSFVNRCLLLLVLLLLPVVHGCGEKTKKPEKTVAIAADNYESSRKNIFEAVRTGTIKDVKYFLDRGATVNNKAPEDELVFHGKPLIFIAATLNPDVEVLKYLIEQGADVNAKDDDGKTPLHYVAELPDSSIDILKCLIEKGANVNAKDKDDVTPLHAATLVFSSNIQILKYLIEKGADVNAKNVKGGTPLDCAFANEEKKEIIRNAGGQPGG